MSISPPALAETMAPPKEDRLGVLSGTARVVRAGSLVTVDGAAVDSMARQWAETAWPDTVADFGQLHFADGTWRVANWMLLTDALNFCFWALPGEPRWRVEWQGRVYDGYFALAAALTRAVAEARPLWDANYLANLTDAELDIILRPVPEGPS